MGKIEPCIIEAIETIENFITEVTGQRPTQAELAQTLKRYFILNEIKDQVVWQRENPAL